LFSGTLGLIMAKIGSCLTERSVVLFPVFIA
jgi:hypothetical protein